MGHRLRIGLLTLLFMLLLLRAAALRPADPVPAVPAPAPPARPWVPPGTQLGGKVLCVGSDTLHSLVDSWNLVFRKRHPDAVVEIEGKGSATAPPALVAGIAQLAPMSRPMKPTEEDAFVTRWGYRPLPVRVAVDTVAIFVHKDNPIRSLSLQQLQGIYANKGGVSTWDDLGLRGAWREKPIHIYGRNSSSGIHTFFRSRVLEGRNFRADVREQPGTASLLLAVAGDPEGIAYAGLGYGTSNTRVVPIRGDAAPLDPGSPGYPLSRCLLIYINRAPGKDCDPVVREFIRLALSTEGQDLVAREGFFALPADVAREELRKVDHPLTRNDLDLAAANVSADLRIVLPPQELPSLSAVERLEAARRLLDEADRLWETDSQASFKVYRQLQQDYSAEVIQLQVRNKVQGRARFAEE